MFKKLRNSFLVLNMTIISVVIIFSFSLIYAVTYNNVMMENQSKLKGNAPITINKGWFDQGDFFTGIMPADFTSSFSLSMTASGDIVRINSYIDMSLEDYQKLGEKAFKKQKDYTTIRVNGREWMYRIIYTNSRPGINVNRDVVINNNVEIQILFLDITESTMPLKKLLFSFVFIGGLTLMVIFGVSWYFANESIRPLKEAWEKQRQFVADASHELKTPLTIINTNSEALISNKKDTIAKQSKWIEYIQNETARMSKLVNDLLYLAKTEDVTLEIEKLPINISEITTEAVLSMGVPVSEKEIELKQEIEENVIVNGDADRFKQVILILLDNAVKYTEPSGTIHIALKKMNKYVRFTVENTGKGISEENLLKIFDRFYREDKVRNSEDNCYGLGLPIAKNIIEHMGGKIEAESTEGEKTVFTITLKIK